MPKIGLDTRFYPETEAGGFTRLDGTVAFYTRVNALLTPEMTVVDLGAGRGADAENVESDYRRRLAMLKGKVAAVIGIDVDDAVLQNPKLDEAMVYDGRRIPLPDASVDMIVSDWTLEHIDDPALFAAEVRRILKPGGWLAARTPHFFSALALASSLIPNRRHAATLAKAQPWRQERDVFPTLYRLNSHWALRRRFPQEAWRHHSYTWSPEPAYHFGNSVLYRFVQVYQYLKRPFLGGECLFVFLRKVENAEPGLCL